MSHLIQHYRDISPGSGWVSHDDCTFSELVPHAVTCRGWWTGERKLFGANIGKNKKISKNKTMVIDFQTGERFMSTNDINTDEMKTHSSIYKSIKAGKKRFLLIKRYQSMTQEEIENYILLGRMEYEKEQQQELFR